MIIDYLKIRNFRNIENIEFEFNKNKNLFLGDNGQGKTNILESIYFLSYLKSFRSNKIENLILDKSKKTTITASIKKNNVNNSIKISIENLNKYFFVNDKKISTKEFYHYLDVLLYYPDETTYINSFPVKRRNLIDRSIFTLNKEYADIYNKYLKCIKQRNNSIKRNIDSYIWEEKIIDYSYLISFERINFINRINDILYKFEETLNGEKYNIVYKTYNIENYKNEMSSQFKKVKNAENKIGYTLLGPHTENIIFCLNGRSIDSFASEGQKRTFLLLFKYAQILDYKIINSDFPILLLDDVSRELDENREKIIIDKILDACGQVFITSTKNFDLSKNEIKTYRIKSGYISQKNF